MQKTFKVLNSVYVFASLIGSAIFLFGYILLDILSIEINLFIFYVPFSLAFISLGLIAFSNVDSSFFIDSIPYSIVLVFAILILWCLFIYLKKNKFLALFIVYITDIAALFWFDDFDVFNFNFVWRLGVKLIFLGILIAHFVIHRKNIKASLP